MPQTPQDRSGAPISGQPVRSALFAGLLIIAGAGWTQCVSRAEVETCEVACAGRGGYAWILVGETEVGCICADWLSMRVRGTP